MNDLTTTEARHGPPRVSGIKRWGRILYLILAVLLPVGIITQVFLAGSAVLVNASFWIAHRSLGDNLGLFIFIMLIVGLLGRPNWRVYLLNVSILLLFMLQYVFLFAMPGLGLPALRALHAVNALIIFWVAVYLAKRTWLAIRAGT